MRLPFSKSLVTGGLGFVGSHIVDSLAEKGVEVSVLDDFSNGKISNLPDAQRRGSISIYRGRVTDVELVKAAVKDVEVVFHEAALVSVQQSIQEPERTNEVNVGGTKCLLEACVSEGVKKFVFASSAAVYGDSQVLPRVETSEPHPLSPYGWSKLEGERLSLRAYEENGLGTTALRYFNIYGPRSTAKQYSGVINAFAESLISGRPPVIYGDGRQTRDFIHVSDIVAANILVASSLKTDGKVLNVGTGRQTSIMELAQLEHDILLGQGRPVSVEHREARQGDVRDSYADISLIKQATGYSPSLPLEEGLRNYFQWLYPEWKMHKVRL
jgi:UDP-glucose 4-epimerase